MQDAACDQASAASCHGWHCSGLARQFPDARTVTPRRNHTFTHTTSYTYYQRQSHCQSKLIQMACLVRQSLSGQAPLVGRWLQLHVQQHSALPVVSWCSDLRGAANNHQLRQHNFCSRGTSPVELSFAPAVQSRDHLRTVQMTAEQTPFSGSMNTALCKLFDMLTP